MRIQKIPISQESLLQEMLPVNYSDAFECVIPIRYKTSADDLQIEFWASRPKWAVYLMKFRNLLVKPLKLNTDNILTKQRVEDIIRGEKSASLNLYKKTESETILYKDDKHLRFYFSTQIIAINENKLKVQASTIVKFHNRIGKLYFFIIAPFHKMLVKRQFARIIRMLISKK